MILMVSGRTDIVAFYSEWFLNRYKEGFLDVRNPFYERHVSRIYFTDVKAIMFCTKNPLPIIKHLDSINKPIVFHVTLTPYKEDIEPNVFDKKRIINGIKELSKVIGIDNVYVRYDPILINENYTLEYHIKSFTRMCQLLDGYINKIIISFVDEYKNVKNNSHYLKLKEFEASDYQTIGLNFALIAKEYNMSVQTCFEENNLIEYGFINDVCLSKDLAIRLTGESYYKEWKARNCHCVEMVDIGYYNSCKHLCRYCYANYNEKQVNNNFNKHNPHSSLLIGELKEDDIIKVRKK